MAIEIGKIRNVGVVGHGGVGKTSLVEAMLFAAGAVTRLGQVDDGSTTTDFDPDEIKRKISINTSVAYCDWKGHRINLVDTPGYGDFIADARAGLRVVEAAVVVVDAVAGVQVQTEKVWKFATEFDLPRAIVVNRLDRERADFFRTLESLGRRLKGRIVPCTCPIGEESGFRGYVDLVKMKAVTLADGKADRGRHPRRPRRPRQGVAREARGGGRRDRRRPAGQVPRGRLARRGRDAQGAPRRHRRRARSCPSCAPPRPSPSASTRCST